MIGSEIARSLIVRYETPGQWSIGGAGNTRINPASSDGEYFEFLTAVGALQAKAAELFLLQRVFAV